jgi:hypothetical protein
VIGKGPQQEVTVTAEDAHSTPDGPRQGGGDRAPRSHDVARLHELITAMQRTAPAPRDEGRNAPLPDGTVVVSSAELHLRAIATLLATLDTYLRAVPEADRPTAVSAVATEDRPQADVRGTGPDAALAAAAARYIARDLAARRLSEFTSAEGYRLARALARIGGVEQSVDRLLAEANTIRLHPAPLTDAVSHSAV